MPTIEVLPQTHTTGATWAYTTLPPAHSVSALAAPNSSRTARHRTTNYENTAARQRQINSRISDLEKDSYRDTHIPVPSSKNRKQGGTQNVRRILASQKTFVNHLADEEALNPALRGGKEEGDEDEEEGKGKGKEEGERGMEDMVEIGGPPLGYARAVCRPSKRPVRTFCEICGYWGMYRCLKCGARYCGLECNAVHQDTRCQKFYA